MLPTPGSSSRARLTVAWVLTLLVAPIAVQGLTCLLSAWTGEAHAAALLTLGAMAPATVAGIAALVRGEARPLAG